MKKLVLALLSALIFASPAFALVGGPWSSNIPGNPFPVNPSNHLGTYQGTLKGKNLSGVMTFVSGSGGQVVVSSSTYRGVTIVISGSGQVTTTPIYSVSTQTVSTNGYASFFFEGKTGQANINSFVDLGDRKLSGIIEGAGSRPVSSLLLRPATQTAWSLTDSVYFNGTFSAKFASSWALNSFSGKGSLGVTKFDLPGFTADLAANPTTADPNTHIVTVTLPIKVAGVKTTDSVPSIFTPPTLAPALPVITGTSYP